METQTRDAHVGFMTRRGTTGWRATFFGFDPSHGTFDPKYGWCQMIGARDFSGDIVVSIGPLSGAFGPDVIATMSEALDAACLRLEHEPRPGLMKDVIAKRIIELVHQGERDARRLCAGALAEAADPLRAVYSD